MSIDQIVKINIKTQSLNIAQKGFGVPLILAFKDQEKTTIELYRNAGELPDDEDAAFGMAREMFAQEPAVPLIKIAFAK
jgi:hypothetical protein